MRVLSGGWRPQTGRGKRFMEAVREEDTWEVGRDGEDVRDGARLRRMIRCDGS